VRTSIAVEKKESTLHFRNVAVHISAPKHNSDLNMFRHSLQTKIGRREYKSYGFVSESVGREFPMFRKIVVLPSSEKGKSSWTA